MQTRTIYIDFDDVLCETARALTRLLEREFGKIVAFDDIHTFNLGESFGIGETELQHLMECGHQPDVLAGFEPVAGAREELTRWADAGYEIEIVTGRPAATLEASTTWLERHGMPYSSIIFVDKYGRELMAEGAHRAISLEALYAREYCLAIEDAPHMAGYLLANMRMPVAVIQRPWNINNPIAESETRARLFRCRDWEHITELFPAP